MESRLAGHRRDIGKREHPRLEGGNRGKQDILVFRTRFGNVVSFTLSLLYKARPTT